MRALLVTAHPLADSLNRHLADQAEAAARAAGHQTQRLDLYGADFDPRLSAEERISYYGAASWSPDQAMERQIEQLIQAELLIVVFPTWWFGFPAILKGWLDRLWRPGIAFDHAADLGRITPRLTGLRHVVAITSLGSPRWIDRLILRQSLRRS
ncbi:MAG: NAD(P)H-dependent oxidoreductase [Paracoccus sp. (in: a-proteobacteria)]